MQGKTDLEQFNNSWYDPGAPKWKILLWYLCKPFFMSYLNPFTGLKVFMLRSFGAKIGKGVVIKQGVNIKYPWNLSVGDFAWIGEQAWIENHVMVSIGKHSCVSQGAMLLTGNHDYSKVSFDLMVGKITLEEGVWIGAKSIVAPGVTCGDHSVLAVMSVASKNLDPFGIYRGNPAEKVKERTIE